MGQRTMCGLMCGSWTISSLHFGHLRAVGSRLSTPESGDQTKWRCSGGARGIPLGGARDGWQARGSHGPWPASSTKHGRRNARASGMPPGRCSAECPCESPCPASWAVQWMATACRTSCPRAATAAGGLDRARPGRGPMLEGYAMPTSWSVLAVQQLAAGPAVCVLDFGVFYMTAEFPFSLISSSSPTPLVEVYPKAASSVLILLSNVTTFMGKIEICLI
ncbi:hypothetical protein BS78_10G123600 [Paspalum vaginatum]|nr:hypothetical protein BS78_10G123600 [Paspalum vaginatum]